MNRRLLVGTTWVVVAISGLTSGTALGRPAGAAGAEAPGRVPVKEERDARAPEQPELDPWTAHPVALEGHLGLGTPVGAIGAIAEYSFSRLLGVGAGLGAGSGPDGGVPLHGAVVARLRDAGSNNAFVLEGAYSVGGYRRAPGFTLGAAPTYSAQWAQWAQADIGWEWRGNRGLLFRFTFGGAWMLNPGALRCTPSQSAGNAGSFFGSGSEPCEATSSEGLVTLDLTLGYAL